MGRLGQRSTKSAPVPRMAAEAPEMLLLRYSQSFPYSERTICKSFTRINGESVNIERGVVQDVRM